MKNSFLRKYISGLNDFSEHLEILYYWLLAFVVAIEKSVVRLMIDNVCFFSPLADFFFDIL